MLRILEVREITGPVVEVHVSHTKFKNYAKGI